MTLRALQAIFMAGVDRADPCRMMKKHLHIDGPVLTVQMADRAETIRLTDVERIFVIGTGKATARMATAAEEILGARITQGLISVKYGHTEPLERIRIIEAGHPVPDENSVRAGREIAALARSADEKTLVINLISGGGSALMAAPSEGKGDGAGLSLADKQQTTRVLLACGATISEINCVRKHLSLIKGGRLARMLWPARSFSFILSDVVGDRPDAIASGPTVPDSTTFEEMGEIIGKYGIAHKIPETVRSILRAGLAGELPDTPGPGERSFDRVRNILIGTNHMSLMAAREKAEALGFRAVILSSRIVGEAREVAKVLCGIGRAAARNKLLGKPPLCIIAGGETTVTLRGTGRGGRNQEMALAFLEEMEKAPDATRGIFFLSASTDGNDGPTDAAGAFAAREVSDRANVAGLSVSQYLGNNDAYHFFDRIGYLLKTGPTNTNVCDLQIMVIC
ncbi:glycerate kinase [Desulfonema ishimotonii]|uniref:Glycerate kinase n=1 Tax=Desulfonema ishimotonii TaxID=45657 RepID=A0A401G0X1_9BACT|nr:glycerate kinase [Desulfonema ishimotonii]GBC62847.1 glycerate kinase [Desulfonema ishimotonii]